MCYLALHRDISILSATSRC